MEWSWVDWAFFAVFVVFPMVAGLAIIGVIYLGLMEATEEVNKEEARKKYGAS